MKALKLYLGIGVVLLGVYLINMLVPPYFNYYRFDDWMEGESVRGSYFTKTADAIRESVIKKAPEYNIHLSREQVRVEVDGRNTRIIASYTVRVALPLYPVHLHFTSDHEFKPRKSL
jgi:hypothetical protein